MNEEQQENAGKILKIRSEIIDLYKEILERKPDDMQVCSIL